MIRSFVLVFLGGGLGSMLRMAVYRLARLWLAADFPWGTLAVNAIGGLIGGLVSGWLVARSSGGADAASLFLITGLLGGFTTFSAFSLDSIMLWQRGAVGVALCYVVASLALALAGAAAGLAASRMMFAPAGL